MTFRLELTRHRLHHTLLPGVAFVAIAALFAVTDLDRRIARAWAFDPTLDRFPAREAWWSTKLLHAGGDYLVWAVCLAVLATLIASFVADGWRAYRRPASFALVAMVLANLAVSTLKEFSNVDCPWDVVGFGGTVPYVPFFADRPEALPPAACFPGAHAAAGFALLAFYFVFRERSRRAANLALVSALAIGAIFAFAQEARGAHFLSHDLWGAFIVWFVELAVYSWLFHGQLWTPSTR